MANKDDEKKKDGPVDRQGKAQPQATSQTSTYGGGYTEAVDRSRRTKADEGAANAQERAKQAAKLREVASKTGAAASDDDPEPQSSNYKSLAEYASARRAWLERRKAKAAGQQAAVK